MQALRDQGQNSPQIRKKLQGKFRSARMSQLLKDTRGKVADQAPKFKKWKDNDSSEELLEGSRGSSDQKMEDDSLDDVVDDDDDDVILVVNFGRAPDQAVQELAQATCSKYAATKVDALIEKRIRADGTCLFRSVAAQIDAGEDAYHTLRQTVVQEVRDAVRQ